MHEIKTEYAMKILETLKKCLTLGTIQLSPHIMTIQTN